MPISHAAANNGEQQRPELWERFAEAASEDEYCSHWLALQCHLIPQCTQALLVLRRETSFAPIAQWPSSTDTPQQFTPLIDQVVDQQCGLIHALSIDHHFLAAYPLLLDKQVMAIIALEISVREEHDLRQIMGQLQWGIAWLEVFFRRQRAHEDAAVLIRLQKAVDLLATTLVAEDFQAAATAFVTELASAMECDRVSLGFVRNRHVRVEAVSHSSHIGDKMNLTRAIALAMDESILQRRELLYPPEKKSDILILRDHEHLSRQQNGSRIVSLPLFHDERYFGVLTCERPADLFFAQRDLQFLRAVSALVTPALAIMENNDRSLAVKIKDAALLQLQRLFGPHYVGRKLLVVSILGLILLLGFAKGEYRLAAQTSLEGMVRRAIVAPFDGYIDQATARAGDVVEQGTLLCTLDDRDLRLERLARISQKSQLQRQHQNAVAKYDRAQAAIIEARLEQASAELELIDAKLRRTRLAAPFSGLLVSGDLSQRLGGAVNKGEVLFEVTPLDAYRVILEVDERWIADVRVGQRGSLVLAAQPDTIYKFTVSQITPLTTAEEGRNFFRVEARLATVDPGLRPGMEGIGKISVDRRHLIAIWSREMIEWLRLFMWRWLP